MKLCYTNSLLLHSYIKKKTCNSHQQKIKYRVMYLLDLSLQHIYLIVYILFFPQVFTFLIWKGENIMILLSKPNLWYI